MAGSIHGLWLPKVSFERRDSSQAKKEATFKCHPSNAKVITSQNLQRPHAPPQTLPGGEPGARHRKPIHFGAFGAARWPCEVRDYFSHGCGRRWRVRAGVLQEAR